jgi:hypothetical protein
MSFASRSARAKTRHNVALCGDEIRVGLFRSTVARITVLGDPAVLAKMLVSDVDHLSITGPSPRAAARNGREFQIALPYRGKTSKFQWRFSGVLYAEGPSATLQGSFRLSPLSATFFIAWLFAATLFVALAAVIATASASTQMWLLPLGGLIILSGGYATLAVGRTLAEPEMHRAASQLTRCLESSRVQ